MKALELTPTSWILYDDYESKIGLLYNELSKYALLTIEGTLAFKNLSELEESFGKINFQTREVKESKVLQLNGFPVDEDSVFNVEEKPFPTYTRTEQSKIRYAAGYWGINYSGVFSGAFCPKVKTLETHDNVGPYDNKFILKDEIYVANKRINNE